MSEKHVYKGETEVSHYDEKMCMFNVVRLFSVASAMLEIRLSFLYLYNTP